MQARADTTTPLLICGLVVLCLPVGLLEVPGPLPLQVVEVAALLTGGLVVTRRLALEPTPLHGTAALAWPAALVVIALLSALLAGGAPARTQAVQLLGGTVLAAALPSEIRDATTVRRLAALAAAMIGVLSLLGLSSAADIRTTFAGGVATSRAEGLFASPNEFGTFAGMGVLIAAGCWLGARHKAGRVAALGGVLVTGAGLTLSLSRGAWIGALGGVVVLAVLLPRARRPLAVVALSVLGLALLVSVVLPDQPVVDAVGDRLASIVADGGGNPDEVRQDIWRLSPGMMAERPWLGSGMGSFEDRFQAVFYTAFPDVAVHAHNVLMTVGIELGVPATLLLLGFTVHLAVVARRTIRYLVAHDRDREAAIAAGFAAALAVHVGQGLVDYTLRNAVLALVTWWVIGMLLAADRLVRSERDARQRTVVVA